MSALRYFANVGLTTINQLNIHKKNIKNIISLRAISSIPEFSHKLYWLKQIDNSNKYAFGIKTAFEDEYSAPQMLFLECEINDILSKNDAFATIENEKASITLDAPFDNAKLLELDEDIDFDLVMESPEKIENRIALFEDINL